MLRKRSATKKNSSGWNIKTILLESFFILLAVLLALLLNEWNNDRNKKSWLTRYLRAQNRRFRKILRLSAKLLNTDLNY